MREVSVVLPVCNEEKIFLSECGAIVHALEAALPRRSWELLIVENGSSDATPELAKSFASSDDRVRVSHLDRPLYGAALKKGILESDGELVAIFNVDFWDIDFLLKGMKECRNGAAVTVGSKTMRGAEDRRPFVRRFITRYFNILLRAVFGFRGTDTHGMKVLRRSVVSPFAASCRTEREVFDTELLLKLQRAGVSIREIPVVCEEKRPGSSLRILSRVPRTVRDLLFLHRTRL